QVADVDEEIERLDKAIEIAIEQIEQLYEKTLETVGLKEAKIFNAHKMMMEDPEFIGDVKETIKSQGVNAEWAVKAIADKYIKMFENIEDEYIRERALDLKDVSNRLLKILLGIESIDLSTLKDEYIIV